MSTFDTAGDPETAEGLDGEAVSGGTPDAVAGAGENLGENDGEADTVDGALSPGSTATESPTAL